MSFGMQYFSYINPTVLEVVDIYLFLWTWKKPQKKKVIKTFFLFPTFSIFKNGMDKWYSSWNRQLCVHSLVMCQARNIARSKVWNQKRIVSSSKFLPSGPKVVLLYFNISNFTFWSDDILKCKIFLIGFLHELGNLKQNIFTFKNAIFFTFYSTGPQIPKNGRLKPTQSLKNWGSNITIPFTITLITNEVLWKKNEQRKTFCGDVLFQIILVKEYGNFHQESSLRLN